jgi:hypothetical protein
VIAARPSIRRSKSLQGPQFMHLILPVCYDTLACPHNLRDERLVDFKA